PPRVHSQSRRSMRPQSMEIRSAFNPSCWQRSISRPEECHHPQASRQVSPERMRPSRSHAAHWLCELRPSNWWAEVETPHKKPSGKVSIANLDDRWHNVATRLMRISEGGSESRTIIP